MLNNLLDNVSATVPDKVALIVEGKTYTYGELSGLTHSLAASLLRRGIRPGDRVAFLLPNCLEIVLCYYACFKIGAIAVPLNIRLHNDLLQYDLTHSGARILISEPALFENIEKIRPALDGVEEYYLTSPSSKSAALPSFSELLDATSDPDRLPLIEESHAAAIYYTSGTTGLPKAVIHSRASLAKATENQITQIAITPEDRTLVMFPICYLIGFGSQILPFHKSGATCVLMPHFEPTLVLKAIQTYQPTKTYGFPKLYNDLVNCPHAGQYNVRSLTFCFSAGEAIPVAVQERFHRIFGLEMIVRGGSMTAGYWRDPELTARNIREGWFHTGDLAYKDTEEIYWFVSRKSEIIHHRDGLVSPVEVEGALYQHPAVQEAGVVAMPDRFGHEVAQAYVVLKEGSGPISERQLIEFAQMRLPHFKVPVRIVFAETLVYGPTGKSDRKTLREKGAIPV